LDADNQDNGGSSDNGQVRDSVIFYTTCWHGW
jgi:hypothetical protein